MEDKFIEPLSDEIKQNAQHIGDGAYMIDHGYQIEIFASNGLAKTPSVYLEDHAIDILYKLISQRSNYNQNE